MNRTMMSRGRSDHGDVVDPSDRNFKYQVYQVCCIMGRGGVRNEELLLLIIWLGGVGGGGGGGGGQEVVYGIEN